MRVTTPYEGQPFAGWDEQAAIPSPLRLHRCVVREEWTDYNGHLSESFFLYIMGDNSDAFFRYFGIDEAYRAAGQSLFTVESHLRNVAEASRGDAIECSLTVLDVGPRKVHIAHTLELAVTGKLLATGEQMLVHVDLRQGRAAEMPIPIRERLEAIRNAHSRLPRREWAGRNISM